MAFFALNTGDHWYNSANAVIFNCVVKDAVIGKQSYFGTDVTSNVTDRLYSK